MLVSKPSPDLPVGDIGRLAVAAGLAVLAVRQQVVLVVLAGHDENVGIAPGIGRDALLQVGAVPSRLVGRAGDQAGEPLLRAGVMAVVQPELVQRLAQRIDLGARDLDLRLADLGKIFGADVAGQEADDHHHHQQLEQGETAPAAWCGWPPPAVACLLHFLAFPLPLQTVCSLPRAGRCWLHLSTPYAGLLWGIHRIRRTAYTVFPRWVNCVVGRRNGPERRD